MSGLYSPTGTEAHLTSTHSRFSSMTPGEIVPLAHNRAKFAHIMWYMIL